MAIEEAAVRREVLLEVDRATAWAALSDPEQLAEWLADEVDLRIEEGAEGWLRWRDGEVRRATVEEVSENRRIVLRWAERAPRPRGVVGPETVVELVLDDVPEGTRLVVVEMPVARLEAIGVQLDQGLGVLGGPQMVAARA